MGNETKWTPGEWLVSGTTVYALTSNDGRMVNRFSAQPQSCMQDHEAQSGELIANAHLIAAAPELYEELDMLMEPTGPGDAAQLLAEERENIMALLAKARGEKS